MIKIEGVCWMNNLRLAIMKKVTRQNLEKIQTAISQELWVIRMWDKHQNLWQLNKEAKNSIGKNIRKSEVREKTHFLED